MPPIHIEPTAFAVETLSGPVLDNLVQAMLDHVVPPLFLNHGHAPSLQEPYDRALARMRGSIAAWDIEQEDAVRKQLHWWLQAQDLGEALVHLATDAPYYASPDDLFDSAGHSGSRVFSVLPSLADHLDDDGLLDCVGRQATDQTLFEGEWSLQYHQLLRRHFSSHINDSLIGVLLASMHDGNTLKLALDERRLLPRAEFRMYGEKDYWYGPPLTEELIDGPYSGGRTVHADPHGDDALDGYTKFAAIWYGESSGLKVVQMEETITAASTDTMATSHRQHCRYRLLRYLHAIRDPQAHEFIHCDGAIRAYDDETYVQRVGVDWSGEIQAARYRKVFRIDGHIPTQTWSDIVARWFRHNPLVLEYLGTLAQPQT